MTCLEGIFGDSSKFLGNPNWDICTESELCIIDPLEQSYKASCGGVQHFNPHQEVLDMGLGGSIFTHAAASNANSYNPNNNNYYYSQPPQYNNYNNPYNCGCF